MDYVIVGAGPSGLTLALLLGAGKKVTIVDKYAEIGGCHRVIRENGKFSEHGPRIYSSTYKTFANLLREMGTSFDKLFTPYKFHMTNIGLRSIKDMKYWELWEIAKAYVAVFLGYDYSHISMDQYTTHFTAESRDYIDRLCRLTDGATLATYSVTKFVQLLNQQGILHDLYQPKRPNDVGLFQVWGDTLRKVGVEMRKATVLSVITENGVCRGVNTDQGPILAKNVILAIPPKPLAQLTKLDANWVKNNSYNDYITITYEWNNRIKLEDKWGFPSTSWGVAYIVLSDYFKDYAGKTLISCGITKVDGTYNGVVAKFANDEQLKRYTFEQLKLSYPELPNYDNAIIGSRIGQETAYVQSSQDPTFIPQITSVSGLYNVGTHNGKAQYAFTSLETAVVNATALAHELEPSTKRYPIINALTLNQLIIMVLLIIFVIIVVYNLYKKYGNV